MTPSSHLPEAGRPLRTILRIAVALAVITPSAQAQQVGGSTTAYTIALNGQRQGPLNGGAAMNIHHLAFTNLSASAGTNFTMTFGPEAFPQLLNAINTGETLSAIIVQTSVSTRGPGRGGGPGNEVITVNAPVIVTRMSISSTADTTGNTFFTPLGVDVTLTATGPQTGTDNMNTAPATKIGSSIPEIYSDYKPTLGAVLESKLSSGENALHGAQVSPRTISLTLTHPASDGGPATVSVLSFTKTSDATTAPLKAAVAQGASMSASKFRWYSVPVGGQNPVLRLEITLNDGGFAPVKVVATDRILQQGANVRERYDLIVRHLAATGYSGSATFIGSM